MNSQPQNSKPRPVNLVNERLRNGFVRLVRYPDGNLSFQIERADKVLDSDGKEVIEEKTGRPKRVYTRVFLDPADMPLLEMTAERYRVEQRKTIVGGDA